MSGMSGKEFQMEVPAIVNDCWPKTRRVPGTSCIPADAEQTSRFGAVDIGDNREEEVESESSVHCRRKTEGDTDHRISLNRLS